MKPLTAPIHEKALWGFDIETYGQKNKFLMGSIVGDGNIKSVFWDKHKFVDFILKHERIFKKGYICATNLQFDFLALFHGTKAWDSMLPITRNSRFLCVKIPVRDKRKYLYFLDTYNYAPFSVSKWGELLSLPKLCNPKCFKRQPHNKNERRELIDYNLRDSMISYKAMKFLQETFNRLNCQLRITTPSTAMDLYRRNYLEFEYRQPDRHMLDFLYKGYYGGRTEAVKRGHITNINYYDVNSLYPSVMMQEYPKPTRFDLVRYLRPDALYENEGVAHATVKSPDTYIPYLPFRQDGKLLFPYGEFEGHYTFFELREAEKLGYEILKIHKAAIYFEKFYPFRDYVSSLYEMRQKYKKENNPMETTVKLCLNSLYGKFAQKIDYKEEILHESMVTKDYIYSNPEFYRSGEFFVFKKDYKHIPHFINPIFSIYTTAYARHRLFQFMQKVNFNNVYYYDTDSIFTSKTIHESDELGDMKLITKVKDGIIVKPKMYMIDDFPKCKGVHNLDSIKFKNLFNDNVVRLERFVKFREANRRNLKYNEIINYSKVIDLEDNKRIWEKRFNPTELQDSQPLKV